VQASPTYVGVPEIGVSESTGGVSEADVAVYSVPANGPEVIVAITRYGLKSSSVATRKRLSGEISD
jgi:hypothetical protein